MTDGFISLDVLPMIGVAGKSRCVKLADALVTVGLFDRAEAGYVVHGYLELNPSRTVVLQKRADDLERKRKGEERRADSERIPDGIPADSRAPRAGVPSHPLPSHPPGEKTPGPSARSKRPMFSGQRLTVFEWMFDELTRLLGPHTDAFDLHEWFFALDAQCLLNHVIPPDRDNGAWLKQQCLLEAQKRGLPLKVASAVNGDEDGWAAIARKGPSVRP